MVIYSGNCLPLAKKMGSLLAKKMGSLLIFKISSDPIFGVMACGSFAGFADERFVADAT